MRGSRGLSLRTRLLLLQLAVTAVFLLVLGIVSTDLFAHNLTSQFNNIILKPGSNVYDVAEDVVALDDDVADVDADPEGNADSSATPAVRIGHGHVS